MAVGGLLVRVAVLGMDWDEEIEGGDIDCPLWSRWLELIFEGDKGEVTPLGLVADDERCRDRTLVPLGCVLVAAAARVAIDGVDGDKTEMNKKGEKSSSNGEGRRSSCKQNANDKKDKVVASWLTKNTTMSTPRQVATLCIVEKYLHQTMEFSQYRLRHYQRWSTYVVNSSFHLVWMVK